MLSAKVQDGTNPSKSVTEEKKQWVETNPSNICKHLQTDIHFYRLMVLR
jgi:hypothetical protein